MNLSNPDIYIGIFALILAFVLLRLELRRSKNLKNIKDIQQNVNILENLCFCHGLTSQGDLEARHASTNGNLLETRESSLLKVLAKNTDDNKELAGNFIFYHPLDIDEKYAYESIERFQS